MRMLIRLILVVAVVAVAVPVAAIDHARVIVLVRPAVLAGRNDGRHGAEDSDDGGGRRGVIVAVVIATAGAGRQGRGSQCNRGRSSNSDCAAGHNTHFDFSSLMLSPHWGSTSI